MSCTVHWSRNRKAFDRGCAAVLGVPTAGHSGQKVTMVAGIVSLSGTTTGFHCRHRNWGSRKLLSLAGSGFLFYFLQPSVGGVLGDGGLPNTSCKSVLGQVGGASRR